MAEVVNSISETVRMVGCESCGSTLRYYKKDVVTGYTRHLSGHVTGFYYVRCPDCRRPVTVFAWS